MHAIFLETLSKATKKKYVVSGNLTDSHLGHVIYDDTLLKYQWIRCLPHYLTLRRLFLCPDLKSNSMDPAIYIETKRSNDYGGMYMAPVGLLEQGTCISFSGLTIHAA